MRLLLEESPDSERKRCHARAFRTQRDFDGTRASNSAEERVPAITILLRTAHIGQSRFQTGAISHEREISLTQSGARTPLDVVRKSPRCREIQSLDVVRFWHSMSS